MHAGDVEGGQAFLLDFVVIENGPLPHHDLCHTVGEVRAACSNIGFDHPGLAVLTGNDEKARMTDGGFAARVWRGHEENLQGIFDNRPVRDEHIRAIVEVRRVQGGKCPVIHIGERAQMLLREIGVLLLPSVEHTCQ